MGDPHSLIFPHDFPRRENGSGPLSADSSALRTASNYRVLQGRLPVMQRNILKIVTQGEYQIENEIDKTRPSVFPCAGASWRAPKLGHTVIIERNYLSIVDPVGQARGRKAN